MNQTSNNMDDELRPEYDFAQMTPVARGRGRQRNTAATVELEPDVAAFFPDAGAVNEGLRLLIRMLQKASPQSNLQSTGLSEKV
ncbi:MAG: hypothetical protein ACFB0D_24635 [Phormidesmis sp.]